MAGWLDWLKPARTSRPLDPPAPAPQAGVAPRDPLGLPDFLARLRIGDRSALTDMDFAAAARRLDVAPAVIRAVVQVECAGQAGFGPDGLPLILFEPHIFSELTRGKFDAAHPDVSYAELDPRKHPRSQEVRWKQLAKAYALDSECALLATNWGAFQIAGLNYKTCGYLSGAGFAASLAGSEARQLEAFEALISAHKLIPALKARRWGEFGAGYKGPREGAAYGRKLDRAYKAIVKPGQAPLRRQPDTA